MVRMVCNVRGTENGKNDGGGDICVQLDGAQRQRRNRIDDDFNCMRASANAHNIIARPLQTAKIYR